jgi:hypothetical protein
VSPRLIGGLALALASAGALNWGFYVQHGAASALPALSPRRPLVSLGLLFGDRRWLTGFVAGVLALLVAAGGIRLERRERRGVALAVLGLALLGASLAGQGTHGTHGTWLAVAAWIAVSAAVAALAAGPFARALAGGAGLGLAAGLLYAGGDVATKAAVFGGARLALVPAVLACHGFAFVALQLAFQRGGALATAGVAALFTNALPILAGTTVFTEGLGALAPLRVLAFICAVAGATLLARPARQDVPAACLPRRDGLASLTD